MAKFEAIPVDTFEKVLVGAGIVLTNFDITDPIGAIKRKNILFATDGGMNISITPEYTDMADGLDNCPSNEKELKRLKQYTVTMSGTAKTIYEIGMGWLLPNKLGASVSMKKVDGITYTTFAFSPGKDPVFKDIWWVGDYGATDGGFVAINIVNALNTAGFSLQSVENDKASFPFTITGHYSIDDTNDVPIRIYRYG